ncbi:MAG: thioredoxin family protein [Bacteroidia bacterium]|nr:thioredoxin family protein [Bacteroidia bacterium]
MKHILLFLILFVPVWMVSAQQDTGYKPGDTAKDFNLKNVDGKMVSLAQYKNVRGFVIIFTCNHCPFAKAYEERIIALDKKYAPLGYPVIAINPNDANAEPEDSYENMIARAKEKNYSFPYLLDETQEVAKTYGAKRTPHIYILHKDEKGALKVKYTGAIDDNFDDAAAVKAKYAEDALQALLSGQQLTITTTKAIGCGIKWKK